MNKVREWIRAGRLAPGKRLPSERVLSGKLKVSRMIVRGALEELERENLIERHARSGWRMAGESSRRDDSLVGQAVAVIAGSVPSPVQEESVASVYGGIAGELIRSGIGILTLSPTQIAKGRNLERLLTQQPMGIIALEEPAGMGSGEDILRALHLSGIPMAALGDVRDWPKCDTVTSDHERGTRELAEWLIRRGCRRLLRCRPKFASAPDWLRRRDSGFEQACRGAGLPVLSAVEITEPTLPWPDESAFNVRTHLWAGYLAPYFAGTSPIDAIMALTDGYVFPIAAACRVLGKDPGRDVTIAGYDNYWQMCPDYERAQGTPAATMDKLNTETGRTLARLLLDRIAGRLPGAPQRRMLPPKLVEVNR